MLMPVPTSSGKHQRKVSVDTVAFYYANGINVLPSLTINFIDDLAEMERQEKVCLLPAAVLEKYHLDLFRRIQHRMYKIQKMRKVIA